MTPTAPSDTPQEISWRTAPPHVCHLGIQEAEEDLVEETKALTAESAAQLAPEMQAAQCCENYVCYGTRSGIRDEHAGRRSRPTCPSNPLQQNGHASPQGTAWRRKDKESNLLARLKG
ncbi:hypothetical protein NDU88_001052 [Pleurodeles waltl]|uniref:Uncharacterized protein n=1 Tax=Pleurodeles waltl TaxID=8319 RepID=A0AAV7VVB8_PLEWA|nr:hypothetical protein NDU88_001052 [Pleurodeles waltl]